MPLTSTCCADGTGACAAGEHCCLDSFGGCCDDGYTCNASNGKCSPGGSSGSGGSGGSGSTPTTTAQTTAKATVTAVDFEYYYYYITWYVQIDVRYRRVLTVLIGTTTHGTTNSITSSTTRRSPRLTRAHPHGPAYTPPRLKTPIPRSLLFPLHSRLRRHLCQRHPSAHRHRRSMLPRVARQARRLPLQLPTQERQLLQVLVLRPPPLVERLLAQSLRLHRGRCWRWLSSLRCHWDLLSPSELRSG